MPLRCIRRRVRGRCALEDIHKELFRKPKRRILVLVRADLSSGPFPFLYQPAECHMLSFVHASAAMHVGAQNAHLAAESFVLSSDYPLNASEPSNQRVY
jgi:hypothetical protein